MEDSYYLLDVDTQEFEKNKFLVVYVYSQKSHTVVKIYKRFSEKLDNELNNLSLFEDITDKISFAVKPSGKVGLDIKL